jgi:exodeoxyribonuclease VII small subunit
MASRTASPKRSLEESLRRLEEIVDRLEKGEVPLEESIALYEEGLTIARSCAEALQKAELRVKTLAKDLDGTFRLLEGDEA